MDKQPYTLFLFFSLVSSLGLVSFVLCIIAESKRTRIGDVKIDDKLCYLPESHAFKYGYIALISAVIAQTIGSSAIFRDCCIRRNENSSESKSRPKVATIILALSWISFGIAVVLLSTATSMSKKQPYGKGWVDHECYLVKDGVYIGSGFLILLSTVGTLGSAVLSTRNRRKETGPKIHAQVG